MSDELRKSCNENGERLQKMADWRNSTQIKGYIALLESQLKSGSISSNSTTDNSAAIIEANENVENFADKVYTTCSVFVSIRKCKQSFCKTIKYIISVLIYKDFNGYLCKKIKKICTHNKIKCQYLKKKGN